MRIGAVVLRIPRLAATVYLPAALCLIFAMFAPSAQAVMTHDYLSQITEVPADSAAPLTGPLSGANATTTDSGDLWIAEELEGTGGSRIDKFNASSGAFISQVPQVGSVEDLAHGIAVGHSTSETQVYVGAKSSADREGVVAVFGPSGALQGMWTGSDVTPLGSFTDGGVARLDDVAVDNSANLSDWAAGDVYVDTQSEYSDLYQEFNAVDVFEPQAGGKERYIRQLTGPEAGVPFSSPGSVTVDESSGDVLVADGHVVDVFEPTVLDEYALVRQITSTPAGPLGEISTVAVDAGDGDIYIADRGADAVDQFSATGTYLGHLTGTPTEAFGGVRSVAADPTSHHVYVGDSGSETGVVDVFGPSVVIPDVTTEAASGTTVSGATLNGTVNPDKGGAATCQFGWGTNSSLGQVAPCSGPVAEGESPVSVLAVLSELQSDTTYYYRLEATNANGTNPGEESQDQEFTTSGPGLHGESAADIASDSATLDATLNPHGSATSYYFQYGTSSEYGTDAPVLSGSAPDGTAIGSGEGDHEVSQRVQGLAPNTTYHYRVVAVSELAPGALEVFPEPDQTFTTQTSGASLQLLDGRAWELVSPSNKRGALIRGLALEGAVQAASDGDAMTYDAFVPTESQPQGYDGRVQVLSRRGPAGWSSTDIATPNDTVTTAENVPEYQLFSSDLSQALVNPFDSNTVVDNTTLLSAHASAPTPYIRGQLQCEQEATAAECYLPLFTAKEGYADVPLDSEFGADSETKLEFESATPTLNHVFVNARVALTATPVVSNELYEWSAGAPNDEAVQLVSLLPGEEGGEPVVASAVSIGGNLGSSWSGARHAISDDGSLVFWQADTTSYGEHLYMRDTVKGETIRLDVQQSGAPGGETPGPRFEIASSSGSRVFFWDSQRLTGKSGTGDLYECEIVEEGGKDKCDLTDITPEHEGQSAEVRNIVPGASDDGSYVYFVANGVQAPGAVPGGCTRVEDASASERCNLYVAHEETGKWTTTFIASLSEEDAYDWGGEDQVFHNLGDLTARVSPSGRYLAFMSSLSLTGYDNLDVHSGEPDEEIYLYDAKSQRLICASCNPTNGRPEGVEVGQITSISNANLAAVKSGGGGQYGSQSWVAASLPAGTRLGPYGESLYQSRLLSDSGRLFFNSSDALVPQDIDGTEDVYEYEPPGVGSCTVAAPTYSQSSDGCVDLISSGTSSHESGFLDASEDGKDVFFLTDETLVRQDTDTALDVYDAHVCTTQVPCVSAPASPPECTTAEACRAAPSLQPSIFGGPASATFSGTGNAMPPASKPVVKQRKRSTRAQRREKALQACHAKKRKRRRAACERLARKRYQAKGSLKTKVNKTGKG
jgi:hypothetical protein